MAIPKRDEPRPRCGIRQEGSSAALPGPHRRRGHRAGTLTSLTSPQIARVRLTAPATALRARRGPLLTPRLLSHVPVTQQGTQLGFAIGWVRGSRALRRPVSPPGDGAGMPAPWLLRTDTPTPLTGYRHRPRHASRGEPGDVVGCAARREPQPPSGDPGASDDGVDAALNAVVACPARCVLRPPSPRPAIPTADHQPVPH